MKVLVTGAAGFIGSDLALRLLERGDQVIGIDNLNDYYDPALKKARLARTADHPDFTDVRIDLEDRDGIAELFATQKPDAVVNLAAQAGVRYSLQNPHAYIDTNVAGFMNLLEGCRITVSSTWCTPPAARSMARTPRCRFRCTTMSTIR
jgi:UDP-glucuronate 4-epimerase